MTLGLLKDSIVNPYVIATITALEKDQKRLANQDASPRMLSKSKPSSAIMLFLTGALFMFMSLGCTFVTIARGGYAGVLLFALIFLVLADACLLLAFLKSGRLIRSLSVIVALPTLWVAGDLLRRAPHVWGLG